MSLPCDACRVPIETVVATAMMTRSNLMILAVALLLFPASSPAQNYRVRLDTRGQAVSFRGIIADSIAVSQVVLTTSGGQETPDGYAVRCGAGEYCYYFRPGPVMQGLPVTASASMALWGFGVEGLAFHATGRVVADVGPDDIWPGTDPSAQLLEGYLEYQRWSIIARAGRQLVSSRLQHMGFDGGWLNARWGKASLDLTGYGGWGLGQAAVVPTTSPVLNPLDEWRPANRQFVAGAQAAWQNRYVDARAEYRREIDPQDHYVVSERTALSIGASAAAFRATGGLDYNLAEGFPGTADLSLTYMHSTISVSAGARRYRPYFSLWTLWGAFSPVSYHAVNTSVQFRPVRWLTVRSRGERYRYDDAGISTALVPKLEDRGWRVSSGATATVGSQWTVDGTYSLEHGPGAAGRFADGALTWTPREEYSFGMYGGSVFRPLELRYFDATSLWFGGRAEWQITAQQRIWADVSHVVDNRLRPDAGTWNTAQIRVRAGLGLTFGSKADRLALPPAHASPR